MNRIAKSAATVLASLLVLGSAGVAAAQDAPPPSPPPTQKEPSADKQAQLDHEKGMLKDRVQDGITAADQQIDALKDMSKTDKGNDKKRDDDLEKQLSMVKDHLTKDIDKIDGATLTSWSGVRAGVDHDLASMVAHLHKVAAVTHIQVPATGAANKQPQ
jgi:hypothetical protein